MICVKCLSDLKIAYEFRQRCWLSDKSLKLSHTHELKNKFKDKISIECDTIKKESNNAWDSIADTNFECEVPIAYDSDIASSEYESQDSLPLAEAFCNTNNETKLIIPKPENAYDPIAQSSNAEESLNIECHVGIKAEFKTEIFVEPLKLVEKKVKKRKTKEERTQEAKEKRAVIRLKDKEMGPRMCDICGRILSSPKTLQMHKKCVHANEQKYACHICPYRGNRKANLTVRI